MLSLSGGISESRTLFFLFYYSFYGQTSIGSYDLMITVGVRNSTKEVEKKTLVNLTTVFRKYAWMKSVWEYVYYCLKTENICLNTCTKQTLNF